MLPKELKIFFGQKSNKIYIAIAVLVSVKWKIFIILTEYIFSCSKTAHNVYLIIYVLLNIGNSKLNII